MTNVATEAMIEAAAQALADRNHSLHPEAFRGIAKCVLDAALSTCPAQEPEAPDISKIKGLLPCPFCGWTEIYIEPDERGSGGQWVLPLHVGCCLCGVNIMCVDAETKEEAAKVWNRRASSPHTFQFDQVVALIKEIAPFSIVPKFAGRLRAILAAPQPVLSQPEVKALEWRTDRTARVLGATWMVWPYSYPLNDGMGLWMWQCVNAHPHASGRFHTESEAKAAAQADYEQRILSALCPLSDIPAQAGEAVAPELCRLTFAVQHNPNCPSPWLVRLPGKGPIDMLPYGDPLRLVKHQTGDILGFGKTFEEAARAALAATVSEGE